MATVTKPYSEITISEATDLIARVGRFVTIIVQGETGIGKSYILKTLAKRFPDMLPLYLDCTTKEAGDLAMPKIKDIEGRDVLTLVPSADMGFHFNKPVILMLDEIGKAARPVQNVLCRLVYERKCGDLTLSEGSVVFATTNLAEENYGDNAPAYMRDRSDFITVRKPTAQEWIDEFAIANDIHATIIQSVSEFPDMLESWRNLSTPGENMYILDPRSPSTGARVTPRGLHLSSDLLKASEGLPDHVRTHMLIGKVGEKAAMDIMAVDALHADLPSREDIIRKPSDAKLPKEAGSQCLLVYSALSWVEPKTLAPLMVYLKRLPKEAQALFCSASLRHAGKAAVIASDPAFGNWMKENNYLFRS